MDLVYGILDNVSQISNSIKYIAVDINKGSEKDFIPDLFGFAVKPLC